MAITRAQQYRQMLKDGSKKPVKQAGVMNYMPSEMVTVPKIAKSSPDTPTAKLAYITPEEQDILIDLNLYGSLDGKPNRGPGGIPSLEGDFGSKTGQASTGAGTPGSYGEAGPDVSGSKDTGTGNYQVTNQTVQDEYNKNRKKREADKKQKEIEEKFKADAKKTRKKMRDKVLADKKTRQQRIKDILSGKFGVDNPYGLSPTELADLKSLGIDPNKEGPMTDMQQDVFDQMMEKNDRFSGVNLENFQNKFNLPKTGLTSLDLVTGLLEGPLSKGAKKTKEFFTDDVLGAGRFKYLGNTVTPEIFSMLDPTEMQEIYGNYDTRRKSGEIDAYGNPTNLNTGGANELQDPCKGPNPPAYCNVGNDDDDDDDTTPTRNLGGLAPRFAGSIFDFTGLADGGIARAGAMDGGRMKQIEMMEDEDTPEGGIMDLESGRQMYFLGKLVKKATRAVKKIVKSPVGKAALMYFGGQALMGAGGGSGIFSGLKGKLLGQAGSRVGQSFVPFKEGLLTKLGLTKGGGSLMPTLKGGLSLGLGIPFALDALGVGKEEEDNSAYEKYMKDMRLDIPALRGRRNLAAAFDGSTYNYEAYADGGRTGYAEGSDEPVAKKTMPLLDMDGQEMDLREEGGFVPLGRMERADDVPARLSKNEFVFTADAVRNAGEGDIDKGAEVMYNMMKNLESGGEVSEESQGLDGAREMFKTSQRLEEVL